MTVSYTIPQILTLKSTDEYVFDPDPYARYNVKLYLYAETLDNTVTFYDSQGNAQEPIIVTSGLEIIAKNANYRKVTFADPNSYSIYMVIQEAVYSSDTDLTCIPPSVDLSIAPLSINVNISAQTISQLSVNVAAWSAGTLSIDIAAQSVGNIAIDLAAITTTTNLNVNLAAQTANIDVALAASSVTLDINLSSITAGVTLDVSVQNASLTVVVSGTADVNISSQTGNLDVNLAASAITLDVNVSNASLTVSVSNSNLDVTIQNSILDVQGSVAITIGTTTYQSIPISIVAQQVGNLAVDIAAQTVGNLAVNIAAQSVGNLDVNLAAQSANINVALAASSATVTVAVSGTANVNISSTTGNLPVSIEASSVSLNVSVGNVPSVNPNFETTLTAALTDGTAYTSLSVNATPTSLLSGQSLTLVSGTNTQVVTVSQTVPAGSTSIPVSSFDANYAYPVGTSVIGSLNATIINSVLEVDIKSQTVGNLAVDIAAQTVGNLNVNIAASAVTLDVNISSQSSNLNVNLAAISATSDLNVAIASSSVTLDVNISSQSANINVALAASSITLTTQGNVPITIGTDTYQSIPVSIVAQQIGNIDVNLAAQTVGNIAVNIAANSAGNITVSLAAIATTANLNVNLNASAVTLDVNVTNASITITGSVSISGVPAVTINAGSAIIGSINEIVSPVSVRSKLATGYQESVEYINYDGTSFFVSGSNGDSNEDYQLGNSFWTQTPVYGTPSGQLEKLTIASAYNVGSSPVTLIGLAAQIGVTYANAFTVLVRFAIYSNNAGKPGSLLYQSQISSFSGSNPTSTLTYFNVAAFFDSELTLSASTEYWLALTMQVTYLNGSTSSDFATIWPAYSNVSGTSYASSVTYINGFPPGSALSTALGSNLVITILDKNVTTTTSPITINQPVTSAVTLNGQLVFKLGLTTHTLDEVGITSFTYSVEDTTSSTFLVNDKTVSVDANGLGVVSATDSETLSAVTLNAGDNLQITVSSLTWYSGALDGTVGSIDTFIDSLDGTSYIVLPVE